VNQRFYVYAHLRKDTGEIFYIGKGSGKRAYVRHGRNQYWERIVSKAGGFTVSLLISGISEDEAFAFEMESISRLKSNEVRLVNLTDGGEGSANPSPETRAKLSASRSGEKNHWWGKPLSPEARAGHLAALKGKLLSQEHRAKLSAAKKGKSPSDGAIRSLIARNQGRKGFELSPEHRARISEATLGKSKHTAESRAKISAAKLGKPGPNAGRVFSDEHKAKIAESQRARLARKRAELEASSLSQV
jgi:hypothetical protein